MRTSERLAALAMIAAHAERHGAADAKIRMERCIGGNLDTDPPAPLSGEWAGESIPELFAEAGVDVNLLDDDTYTEACDLYEECYEAAWYLTIERE